MNPQPTIAPLPEREQKSAQKQRFSPAEQGRGVARAAKEFVVTALDTDALPTRPNPLIVHEKVVLGFNRSALALEGYQNPFQLVKLAVLCGLFGLLAATVGAVALKLMAANPGLALALFLIFPYIATVVLAYGLAAFATDAIWRNDHGPIERIAKFGGSFELMKSGHAHSLRRLLYIIEAGVVFSYGLSRVLPGHHKPLAVGSTVATTFGCAVVLMLLVSLVRYSENLTRRHSRLAPVLWSAELVAVLALAVIAALNLAKLFMPLALIVLVPAVVYVLAQLRFLITHKDRNVGRELAASFTPTSAPTYGEAGEDAPAPPPVNVDDFLRDTTKEPRHA